MALSFPPSCSIVIRHALGWDANSTKGRRELDQRAIAKIAAPTYGATNAPVPETSSVGTSAPFTRWTPTGAKNGN